MDCRLRTGPGLVEEVRVESTVEAKTTMISESELVFFIMLHKLSGAGIGAVII